MAKTIKVSDEALNYGELWIIKLNVFTYNVSNRAEHRHYSPQEDHLKWCEADHVQCDQ